MRSIRLRRIGRDGLPGIAVERCGLLLHRGRKQARRAESNFPGSPRHRRAFRDADLGGRQDGR